MEKGLISMPQLRPLLLGLLAALMLAGCGPLPTPTPQPTPTLRPTPTAEPLIPSPTPAPPASEPVTATSTPTVAVTPSPAPTATATRQIISTPLPSLPPATVSPTTIGWAARLVGGPVLAPRQRIGVAVSIGAFEDYAWGAGLPGWWLNWQVLETPPRGVGASFVQMVRLKGDGYRPDLATITRAARANRGQLWLIGNEPDVKWQDNVTPEQYAATYGILYRAIKEADPQALVAIGGVSVPTPLRMAYLDRILAAYRARFNAEMPIDVWNVHAFILREERNSWGVDIPPGMTEERGQLYEIADHADMTIFRRQMADFRRWMADRGQRNKPLVVTEYSILMPESYGFPPELVSRFMIETFDYFLTARDPQTGYPADDNRLVQAFCWYSTSDTVYPTSNLFDPQTGQATLLGNLFRAYVAGLGD